MAGRIDVNHLDPRRSVDCFKNASLRLSGMRSRLASSEASIAFR